MTRALVAAALLIAAPAPADEFAALLGKVVKDSGVDYELLRKERAALDRYVKSLAEAKPGETDAEKIAFWINAYNALTLQQVLDTKEPDDDDYSVKSSVDGFWTKRTWTVAGKKLTLDGIEKGILLKEFDEPLVHFAVNCASVSCPPLQNRPWKPSTLEHDLKRATIAFLADKEHNEFDVARRRARISKIFDWYRADFEKGADDESPKLQQFFERYGPTGAIREAMKEGRPWRFSFQDYDWSLNAAGRKKESGSVNWFWLALYLLATLGLLAYGFHAYKLIRWKKKHGPAYEAQLAAARAGSPLARTAFPRVLVQLPVYNEAAVAERAVDAVAAIDWPDLEIQVLDDSTDETCAIVDAAVARHRAAGVPIEVVRRPHREGFKAGALAAGLRRSDASFVVLFDADFVPEPDFVRRAMPLFDAGGKVACVQGRWGHVNRSQNWLTRAQAVSVDAHFRVQQFARAAAGKFLNFNGTAGVWRVGAIEDAGGWVGDTLTEDLDLSYRAQLAGWRIVFDKDLVAPAELPPMLAAFKSQQRRWACGSIQCARKFLGPVWRARLPLGVKLEATMHLCGYAVCVAMVMLIAVLPFGFGHWPMFARYPHLWPTWVAIWVGALGPITLTTYGQAAGGRVRLPDVAACFLLGLGACMNNAIAVMRGLVRPIRTFVRTPKQGSRPSRLRAPVPVTEQVTAAASLAGVVWLAHTSPWITASYALFCCAGFCTLAGYWWLVEKE